jgi:FAD:protein FMN transferase
MTAVCQRLNIHKCPSASGLAIAGLTAKNGWHPPRRANRPPRPAMGRRPVWAVPRPVAWFNAPVETVTLAGHAMATRFELVLHGGDPAHLRAAGEEALREIARLEAKLSLYQPAGEVAHLNARAAREPVLVSPELFQLLLQARQLSGETGGAFDLTVAPLMRSWGFMRGTGHPPDPEALAGALACTGMDKVLLDEAARTVRFACEGVMLDFGSLGKGYALELAAGLLREAGVTSALLHGGTSTVVAIGRPPDAGAWRIAIPHPADAQTGWNVHSPAQPLSNVPPRFVATVPLRDESLSVSAVWGKAFEADGRVFGHVIDPRTGQPAQGALLAAVVLPSATETDALSTALLIGGEAGLPRLSALRAGMRMLVVSGGLDGRDLRAAGTGIEHRDLN